MEVEDEFYIPQIARELLPDYHQEAAPHTGVVHEIGDWNRLMAFLDGTLGTNRDTFVLTANIAPPTDWVSLPNNRTTDVPWNNARIGRPGEFTGIFDGQGYSITGLVLRPRRNVEHETGSRTLVNTPYLNDYGFFRLLGHGAVVQNLTFIDALFYDGGNSTNEVAHNTRSTVILNGLAGGNGPTNPTGITVNTTSMNAMNNNSPTNRGLVAGRVASGATVNLYNVNIGHPITGDGTTRASGYGVNNISVSRHRGLWNFRMGGLIGSTEEGSIVNITNSDVSVRLFNQMFGAGGRQGGLVGESRGAALNVINVNVNVEMTETNSGSTHTHNTLYAGGIVGRNFGVLHVSSGDNEERNTIHAYTTRGPSTPGHNSDNRGGTSGAGHGFFRNVGRVTGFSSGHIYVNNINLTGQVFGLVDIGGVVGISTSALVLSNMDVSGGVGGTHMTASGNALATRGMSAGGVAGRTLGPALIENVHVNVHSQGNVHLLGNIYGGRYGRITATTTTPNAPDTIGVGGFIGAANAVIIANSSFNRGTLNMVGNTGGLIGRAAGTVIIEDSVVGADAVMINGGTHRRHRVNGHGGIIGRVVATGRVDMYDVVNRMPVQSYRGDIGGIIGRSQGIEVNLTRVENHGAIRQLQSGAWRTSMAGRFDDQRSAGGLIGNANNTDIAIRHSKNYGDVTGYADSRGVGGIVGRSTGAIRVLVLDNVENDARIQRHARPHGHVGGLIGIVQGVAELNNVTNTGDVSVCSGIRSSGTGGFARQNTIGGLIGRGENTTVIADGTNEGHVVNTMDRTIRGIGGLIGYSRSRVAITNSRNSGDVASATATARRQIRADANIGGIIGRSDMRTGRRDYRQTVMTNVVNTGYVGIGTNPIVNMTWPANRVMHTAGGIIGRTMHRPGGSYLLTGVVNEGNIRGRNYSGGIIGFNSSTNVTVRQSANYGAVLTQWGTTARGHAGGFIGRTGRNDINVIQSYNVGEVRSANDSGTLGTGGAAAPLRRGSHGGFIGNITSGRVNIIESFNAGPVRGVERNTGGLVGMSQGMGRLTITDSFNIGDVTSQLTGAGVGATHPTRRARSGNGILGFRGGGPVVMERVYNAGFVQGRPIYGNPRVVPGGAIGSYMRFINVFYDSTVHTGAEQTIARGTIAGASTDIMTRGILPGFTGYQWLNGTLGGDDGLLLNTYPYLAWQTGRELERNFFYSVREIPGNLRAVTDLDGSGNRGTRFTIGSGDVDNVRYFMPYTQIGDSVAPGRGVEEHFELISEISSDRSFTRDGLISAGVVSENWVVGFDIRDRTGVAVIGVDGIDYAIDPLTAQHISWARFAVDGVATHAPGGILIVDWPRNVQTQEFEHTNPRYVEVSALGYADASRLIVIGDYLDNPENLVRIPMDRVDIDWIEVRVVTEVEVDDETTRTDRIANSTLHHNSNSVIANQPGAVNTRYFHLDSVQWRDILLAAAPNFRTEEYTVSFGSFELQDPQLPPGPGNRHILYIYLDDLRMQPSPELRVMWYDDRGLEDDDSASTAIWHNANAAASSAGATTHLIEWYNPDGLDNITTSRIGRNDAGRHTTQNLLYTTQVRVGAPGFRTSEWEVVEEMIQYDEEGENRLGFISAYLERLITLNFSVVEYVFVGFNDDWECEEYGLPIYERREVPNVAITRADQEADAAVDLLTATRIRGIEGESVRISGGDGFIDYIHTISWIYDIVNRMDAAADEHDIPDLERSTITRTGIGEPDALGLGGTNATGQITIVLNRTPAYYVILESATPMYGVVTPNFVSVEVGETLSSVSGLVIETTPAERFRFWDSTVGGHAGGTWNTTAQIMELPITVPFTRFGAHFNPPDAEPEFTVTFFIYNCYEHRPDIQEGFEDYGTGTRILGGNEFIVIEVDVTPGESRSQWDDLSLLEDALSIGNIYGVSGTPGHAFWGWFQGSTLTDSGRINDTTGLRRPALGDECEVMVYASQSGNLVRRGIIEDIETAQDDGDIIALFGSVTGGNLDLFAIWSLWGDVDDDDEVTFADLELLRRYLYYNHLPWENILINHRAARVTVGTLVTFADLELLRRYLYYSHLPWENIILGIAP
jgi:hypothetical protein